MLCAVLCCVVTLTMRRLCGGRRGADGGARRRRLDLRGMFDGIVLGSSSPLGARASFWYKLQDRLAQV